MRGGTSGSLTRVQTCMYVCLSSQTFMYVCMSEAPRHACMYVCMPETQKYVYVCMSDTPRQACMSETPGSVCMYVSNLENFYVPEGVKFHTKSIQFLTFKQFLF